MLQVQLKINFKSTYLNSYKLKFLKMEAQFNQDYTLSSLFNVDVSILISWLTDKYMGWFLIVATIYYVDTYLRYIGCMFTVLQSNHRCYVACVPSDVEAVEYR